MSFYAFISMCALGPPPPLFLLLHQNQNNERNGVINQRGSALLPPQRRERDSEVEEETVGGARRYTAPARLAEEGVGGGITRAAFRHRPIRHPTVSESLLRRPSPTHSSPVKSCSPRGLISRRERSDENR